MEIISRIDEELGLRGVIRELKKENDELRDIIERSADMLIEFLELAMRSPWEQERLQREAKDYIATLTGLRKRMAAERVARAGN